jgi:shikimate kinase
MSPSQTFLDLYQERCSLYATAADLTIDCNEKSQDEIVQEIHAALS